VKDNLHKSESGATSSHVTPRYDLVPREFLQILAQRYTGGADKHGPYNYRKGLRDRAFIVNRIGHIHEHLGKLFQSEPNAEDSFTDNIGAIGWGVAFLAEVWADPDGRAILLELMRP
jgi:hypothetical protein